MCAAHARQNYEFSIQATLNTIETTFAVSFDRWGCVRFLHHLDEKFVHSQQAPRKLSGPGRSFTVTIEARGHCFYNWSIATLSLRMCETTGCVVVLVLDRPVIMP